MTHTFSLMTDSSCDLSTALAQELSLHVVPLSVYLDGRHYENTLDWREITPKEFFDAKRAGAKTTTSAPNVKAFELAMEEILSAGQDVLYLAFSSGLSGTYSAGCVAASILRERYPQRRIEVIDTLCGASGLGLLCYYAGQMRLQGKSLDEVIAWVGGNRLRVNHWFAVDDLKYLRAGGRISATTAIVGTMLNIKPIIRVNDDGKLEATSKVRGRKCSLKALFEQCCTRAVNPKEQVFFLNHADCEEDALYLRDMIENQLHPKAIFVNSIGPVIGSHTGPGLVVVFFLGESR